MEYPNPKIKYYRVRTFGERLSATFDYLRETWKPMLSFTFYFILPICLVQSFVSNSVMRLSFLTGYPSDVVMFVAQYLCILLGSIMLSALVYTLMQEYERRETRLMGIKTTDFKSLLIKNIRKVACVSLFLIAVVFLYAMFVAMLAVISPWTLIVTILLLLVGMVALLPPLTLFLPAYIFEDSPFVPALRKAFVLGFRSWGETFLIILLFGLLANIINMATSMPWYILTFGGYLMGYETEVGNRLLFRFLTYLLGIVQSYGIYLAAIVTSVGYAFQYFHVREKNEHISVDDNIRDFDKL
jgi:hypothetical protein